MSSISPIFPANPNHPFYDYVHSGIEIRSGIETACEQRTVAALGDAAYDLGQLNNPSVMARVKEIQEGVFREFSCNKDYVSSNQVIASNLQDRVNFFNTCQAVNELFGIVNIYPGSGINPLVEFIFQDNILGNLFRCLTTNNLDYRDQTNFLRHQSLPPHQFSVGDYTEREDIPPFSLFSQYVIGHFSTDKRCQALVQIEQQMRKEKDPQSLLKMSASRREILSNFYRVYPFAYEIPRLMEQFKSTLRKMIQEKAPPIEIAAFVHMNLVEIHPGIDTNGRISRIVMNIFLRMARLDVVFFPSHKEYIAAVREASSKKDHRILAALIEKRLKTSQ